MASNFFNKASLVMVPDAPIDGKLPSVKPEDRSGDFTFSRGSNLAATRVNKSGLIEKGRENLLLQSNQFDTTWTYNGTSVISGQEGYDGSSDAWLLNKLSAANFRYIYQDISSSGVQSFSVYAKAGSLNTATLYVNASVNYYIKFNLVDGSVLDQSVAGVIINYNAQDVGSGWWRISVTINDSITRVRIYPEFNSAVAGSIYIQDAQVEQGLGATEYIETTTAAVQKGILENLPRIDYSGGASCPSLLLEPQRTQLIPQSEYFGDTQWPVDGVSLDANNATSPEGLQNAYKITDDTSTGYHKITKTNVFAADGTMRTWSVFVKKGNARYCVISHAEIFSSYVNSLIFDMQEGVYTNEGTTNYFDIVQEPIDMGNGWWRIGFSSDLNSSSYDNFSIGISRGADWLNNASYTGDGSLNFYIYGAQCELGSYPTSYIPAYGPSVTRSFDNTSTLDLTDAGVDGEDVTYFFEFKNNQDIVRDSADIVIRVSANTGNLGSFRIYRSSSSLRQLTIVFQNHNGDFIPNGYEMTSDNPKIAIKRIWSTGQIQVFVDGTEVIDAVSNLFNRWYKMELKGAGDVVEIKQVVTFPTALTDDECIALTTI